MSYARPPLERMMRIHHRLKKGDFPNCTTLSKEMEVSKKTVQRDLDFMRDRLNQPLAYFPGKFGYGYTAPFHELPSFKMTEGDLMAFVLAEQALRESSENILSESLRHAIEKMILGFDKTIAITFSEMEGLITRKAIGIAALDENFLAPIRLALAKQVQLSIDYRKPHEKKTTSRRIDPYHLSWVSGMWYLSAFDHERQDYRTFSLSRMSAVRCLEVPFEKRADAPTRKSLDQNFGVFQGDKPTVVRLRFSPEITPYIREREWHSSQKTIKESKLGIEIEITVTHLLEIKAWIMSWGDQVEVLAPQELRDSIRKSAKNIVQKYR